MRQGCHGPMRSAESQIAIRVVLPEPVARPVRRTRYLRRMTIELLYFEGCPSWREAWSALGDALARTGVEAEVRLVDVRASGHPDLTGFAGSPSVRIDGRDLEGYDGPPVDACRRYEANGGKGWPSAEDLAGALDEASRARGVTRPG